jgi:hypothetical protein
MAFCGRATFDDFSLRFSAMNGRAVSDDFAPRRVAAFANNRVANIV